jgi:hypothetical protein
MYGIILTYVYKWINIKKKIIPLKDGFTFAGVGLEPYKERRDKRGIR